MDVVYTANIEAALPKEIVKSLKAALPVAEQRRFITSIEEKEGKLVITVKAEDATALRAALNSYLRILQAIEKVV